MGGGWFLVDLGRRGGGMIRSMNRKAYGFTIVELLIVIVVIGVLAAISVVAYNGITEKVRNSALRADLSNAQKQLKLFQVEAGSFPATADNLKFSPGITHNYIVNNSSNPQTFCLDAQNGLSKLMVTESEMPMEGGCINLALGASVSGVSMNPTRITDGNTAYSSYAENSSGVGGAPVSAVIDLGSAKLVSMVKVWHYYGGTRSYHQAKTEVSEDGASWQTVFDGAVSGTYVETAAGKTHKFSTRKVRYIRDSIAGSTANSSNHWVEIQAF